ncbi:MAG: TolC family protein [Acidobacteria bacterium]|nr:TolC family protein [Acidobacteriota bacterium]
MTGKNKRFLIVTICLLNLTLAGPLQSKDLSPRVQAEFNDGHHPLNTLIQQALERNPEIRQSFARYRAALQKLPQVRSLPDPMLSLTQYLRSPETRVGPQTTMVTLSQKLPWFGKLSDKEKIAAKEAAVYRYLHEAKKADVIQNLKRVYYSLGYIDRALDITKEDISILEHYEALARARYQQGVGLQQGVVKLQAEITRDKNRLEEFGKQRVDLEAVLNSLRDFPSDSHVEKVFLKKNPAVRINREELYRIGRASRPEIQAALLQIEKNEKRIHLARKNYRPDITIGAGFTNVTGRSDPVGLLNPPDQNGKNIYSFTVGINIPIRRKKYDAAVAEATQDKIASREGYRNAVNLMDASIRSIGFQIETLERQIALFENTLTPQAEQALRSTEAAYSTGEVGVLDLLDSERVLLDVRLSLEKFNSDYMKSVADMERAIGIPFEEIEP